MVYTGRAVVGNTESSGDVLVLDAAGDYVTVTARTECRVIVASSAPHNHELITGSYSVHTNSQSLTNAESKIEEIRRMMKQQGLL